MQSKGAIRFVAILLAIACLWQLSFTLVTKIQENKAVKYAQAQLDATAYSEAERIVNANAEETGTEATQEQIDSVKLALTSNIESKQAMLDELEKSYLDEKSLEKVYFGYTYKDVKAKEINLGLDLKGGMNVMLQVQLEDLVVALAGQNGEDPDFVAAVETAKVRNQKERADFITLFKEEWNKQVKGERRLAEIFSNLSNSDIKSDTSDDTIIEKLKEEANSAIANSFQVLRNRIDRFGVTQPNIQKIGNNGRILVELPGVKEPERVRNLLKGTASLEFWETYTVAEFKPWLDEAMKAYDERFAGMEGEVASLESILDLNPNTIGSDACIGYASAVNMEKVDKWFENAAVKACLPSSFKATWSAKPSDRIKGSEKYELVALNILNGTPKIDGTEVADARSQFGDNTGGNAQVSMTMKANGARIWANMTKVNKGRQIAIVLDGLVYSYPTVQNEITGGSSQITGNFTVEEAKDLANILKSGKLPAPATIIQEQVVGPTLGQESINAGLISFIIAFCLVLIYMIVFYQGAGAVADIALLCNVLFLFGTLVSFGAVLTLPGIAGLVLTLGMAVDANVIIYERVKEELRAGKGLALAVKDGYSNAYSAIIDGQITTALTGIVLFVFGSGPVQGFATTLIIGIITSVVTSIFITRIIFDDRIAKGKKITFDNTLTRNFLQNTKVDFLSKRMITYIISGVLIVGSILSIGIKGFTYGVDFKGGHTYVVKFDQTVSTAEVRSAVQAAIPGNPEVKQFGNDAQLKITTTYKANEEGSEVDAEIEALLYDSIKGFFTSELTFAQFKDTAENPYGIISSDKVGPSIAADITRDAIIAVILSLVVIFGYIALRFRNWTWGLGGVASLTHTALIVIGFFSLFSGILPFSLDVDQTFIAAILTIIGYAINDNVVIFDRIREYKTLHPKSDLRTNVNSALNSTLSRTMNTSLTTLVVMIAIAIFGGEVIRGLAVALILGIVIGTYASIFIGTPVMYDLTMALEARKAKKAKK